MRTAVVIFLLASPASAADPQLSAKVEKTEVPAAVAEPIRKLLTPEALVVRGDNDDVVMRVWFRAEIPAKATAEQLKNGLTYREIPEGTIVGVLEFPKPFVDYRKQELPAGVYTLRFAIQPDIGDHTGVAPHTEFCLLSHASEDKSAEPLEVKALIEQSAKVNEGKHPAVLLLFPNNTKDDGPKVVGKGGGVWAVNVRRAVVVGETKTTLGFGVTVAGAWKQ